MMMILEIGNGFNDLWVEEWLTKEVEAEASSTILSSFIHNSFEQSKIHVVPTSLSWTVRAQEIAGGGNLNEDMPRVGVVDPRLGTDFV